MANEQQPNSKHNETNAGIMFLFCLMGLCGGGAGGAIGGATWASSMGAGADDQFIMGGTFAFLGAMVGVLILAALGSMVDRALSPCLNDLTSTSQLR